MSETRAPYECRIAIDAAMSEAELLEQVLALARLRGYLGYHTHRSEHSEAGFPDLVLLKPSRLIFAELKTESGRLTREQRLWLAYLEAVADHAPNIEVYLWRPSDWAAIDQILS